MYYYDFEKFKKDIHANTRYRNDSVVSLNSISLGRKNNVYINGDLYKTTDTFHTHLAQKLSIPMIYYRKMMKESRELLSYNVNTWLGKAKNQTQVLLRSHIKPSDNKYRFLSWHNTTKTARGLLSNRYKIMDNAELLTSLEDVLEQAQVLSAYHDGEITNIKIRFPSLIDEIKQGDTVYGGLVLRNSELGFSSISVTSFIYRLVCTNGLMLPHTTAINKKYHIGKPIKEISYGLPQDLIADISNMVKDMEDKTSFRSTVENLKNATDVKLKKVKYKNMRRDYNTTQAEEKQIKEKLEESNDYTKYGLIQAITATAKDIKIIQRSIHLEKLGGIILNMNNEQWDNIAA